MGAARKLQTEIDRTLKKVQEGVDTFDQIWKKVYDAENLAQKEKYESDLKKEIKKLQRYRDQIKTWAASNEIKDKKQLLDARKQIEREMERFKVCEKETKTKAFSKEGLGLAAKVDPKDRAKMEMRDWLNNTVETLSTQVDEFEFEMEGLNGAMKKNKPPPRLAHLEESVARHKEHVRRLEQMLRLLDNETISPEEVADVKDLVDDYLDRNQEDFDDFCSPDDLYDDLLEKLDAANALDAVPALVPVAVDKKLDKKEKEKDKEREAEREAERKRERDRQAAAALKNQVRGLPPAAPVRAASMDEGTSDTSEKKVAKAASSQKEVAKPAGQPAATAAQVAGSGPGAPSGPVMAPILPASPVRPEPQLPSVTDAARSAITPDVMTGRGSTGNAASAGVQPTSSGAVQQVARASQLPQQQPSWMFPGAAAVEQPVFPHLGSEGRRAEILPDQKNRYLSRYQQVQQNHGKVGMIDPSTGQIKIPQQDVSRSGALSMDVAPEDSNVRPPISMEGVAATGVAAGKREDIGDISAGMSVGGGVTLSVGSSGTALPTPYNNMVSNQQLLQSCAARSIPQSGDSTWNSYAPRPRAPQGVSTPASYPTSRLPILDNPALFEKLDSEALFFAFYHQPGSFQQYLAARELKRQSWRYHKVHGAWFQRHEEPTAITDEYEQGTYVYFDYNIMHDDKQSGWCYRLKQDFTFEYDALEDELVI